MRSLGIDVTPVFFVGANKSAGRTLPKQTIPLTVNVHGAVNSDVGPFTDQFDGRNNAMCKNVGVKSRPLFFGK